MTRNVPGRTLRRFAISLTLYYPFEPFPHGPFLATAYWTLPIEITFYALIFTVLVARQFHQIERVAVVLCVASSLYLVAYSLHCSGFIEFEGLEFNYFGWKNLTLLRHGVYFSTGIFLWLWSEGLLSRLGRA